jgi:hypothetical protein
MSTGTLYKRLPRIIDSELESEVVNMLYKFDGKRPMVGKGGHHGDRKRRIVHGREP